MIRKVNYSLLNIIIMLRLLKLASLSGSTLGRIGRVYVRMHN